MADWETCSRCGIGFRYASWQRDVDECPSCRPAHPLLEPEDYGTEMDRSQNGLRTCKEKPVDTTVPAWYNGDIKGEWIT